MAPTLPVSLIHGPPGTGKTKVIKEIILQCLKKGEKILVTAFSNAGCDNITQMVNIIRFHYIKSSETKEINPYKDFSEDQFLRIGNLNRIKNNAKEVSLEEKENKSYFKICLNKISHTLYSPEDKYLVSERKNELEAKLNSYREILIHKSQVIFTTCVSAGSFSLKKYLQNKKTYFDLVIIDEASQALEAACWIPMLLGKKVIFVGDFKQIGPIVNSNHKEFSYTLFEKLYEMYGYKISSMLKIQYRMNKKIMQFPSDYFYGGELEADYNVENRTLSKVYKNKSIDHLKIFHEPLIFVNTEGYSLESRISKTKFNTGEAKIVKWFVDYLIYHGVEKSEIGVITPYAGQVYHIKTFLKLNIEVSTVDAFQGSEKEVIILSFVRSNSYSEIGFLADLKRINVALTRPKSMLIVICDSGTLNCNSFLKQMVSYYSSNSMVLDPKYLESIKY
jgi:predicted DNA helicase